MKKSIINVFIFAVGAAIGSAVTWKFAKTKYEQIAKEEIESVKEVYSRKDRKPSDTLEEVCEDLDDLIDDDSLATSIEEANKYCDELLNNGYTKVASINTERRGKTVMNDGPYVISPEEFDELDGYQAVSLTYFSDGVVANMWDSKLDDDEIEEMIGNDFANHFGEYEDEAVFIRNDELRADYEINYDHRNYSDVVVGDDPQQDDE